LALCQASTIASSTISIPTNLSHIPNLRKLIPILPVPQYKSKIVPLVYPVIFAAVWNNVCAAKVFV